MEIKKEEEECKESNKYRAKNINMIINKMK